MTQDAGVVATHHHGQRTVPMEALSGSRWCAMNDFIVGQMAHERQADLDREAARVALVARARQSPAADLPSGSGDASPRSLLPAAVHRLAAAWHRLPHPTLLHSGHAPR